RRVFTIEWCLRRAASERVHRLGVARPAATGHVSSTRPCSSLEVIHLPLTKTRVEFEHPADYRAEIAAPAGRVRFLAIPKRRYLMIEGDAKPADQGFRDAIGTLYPVAYTLHFNLKKRGVDAPVGALEGLYWDGKPGPIAVAAFSSPAGSRRWSWRLLLPVPDQATAKDVAAAIAEVKAKKDPPLIDSLRCESWAQGNVAQTMHIGPYGAETPTIERLHAAITENSLTASGCHHEIYISDPNRTKPEKMKTIIRQAVS
ncbi:MAG TPA: GyrI-like domain-containing protein, partial [Candidatus Dormibacteraeota bacterium]|nr:GyrI-like domain-containing protein [Candidatus Dormibacteraeota bacterium]